MPGPGKRLPVLPVARVPLAVVAAIPCRIEDPCERRGDERRLLLVGRIGDEIDTPLPSPRASDAAVSNVLVESDHVTWCGLHDHIVALLAKVRTRPDPKCAR